MANAPVPSMLRVLAGDAVAPPPVWVMRQAGRYLPEYRALRAQAPDFIAFCLSPEMAAEATLQPMRRFPLDAAIVFADILLVPLALGQKVWFAAGEGPKLGALPSNEDLALALDSVTGVLAPVGETLTRVREILEPERALIGFAGAPWTVATYMVEGGGSPDKARARALAYEDPARLDGLIDVLVEATVHYLKLQALSGAQVLQLFESWAEGLPEDLFERLVIGPHARIVERLRDEGVETPVIGFPRGCGALINNYVARAGVTAVALDTQAPLKVGAWLQAKLPIQGAFDPMLLKAGGERLEARVDELKAAWGGGPWIFNLGHGIDKDTPIAHVERLIARVKGE